MSEPVRSVSIIVLNWRGERDTARCVQSVQAQCCSASVEIIVVDNESTEESKASIERIGGCQVVTSPRNLGFCGGMNAGAAVASGEVIGLLNNDLVLAPDWIQRGLDLLDARPDVGMLGGVSYLWDNSNAVYDENNEVWGLAIVDPLWGSSTLSNGQSSLSEVSALDGSNLLIRSRCLANGLADLMRTISAYGEDVDLSARCSAAGFRIFYEPAMRTWHRRNVSSGPRFRLRREFWSRRNHIYNIAKHFPELEWRYRTTRIARDYLWYGTSGRATGIRAARSGDSIGPAWTRVACIAAGLWGYTHRQRLIRKRREVVALGLHDELWTQKVGQRFTHS